MTKAERIITDKYIRPGDRVVVQYDASEDISYQDLPPSGTVATAIGPQPLYDYRDYHDLWMPKVDKPGVYLSIGAMQYLFQINGEWVRKHLSAHYLVFEDQAFDPHSRHGDMSWEMYDHGIYLGPLPELEFSVGDRAMCRRPGYVEETEEGVIANIFWRDIGQTRDDGTPYPIYDVEYVSGASSRYRPHELTLIERGNYYWWKHDKSKIRFQDLQDEIHFFKTLGESRDVFNPADGSYAWSLEDAIAAIRKGEADGISLQGGLFGRTSNLFLFKFHQRLELGERCRAATIKGVDYRDGSVVD